MRASISACDIPGHGPLGFQHELKNQQNRLDITPDPGGHHDFMLSRGVSTKARACMVFAFSFANIVKTIRAR